MTLPRLVLVLALALVCPAALARADGPAPLSADTRAPAIDSTVGSGAFGHWVVDDFGLPAYDYEIDHTTDLRAPRIELNDKRDAWHQIGNDAVTADAHADGYTQLWNQSRVSMWANRYDPARRHFGGGFGWLRDGASTTSTFWLDRPAGNDTPRRFGVGYASHQTRTAGVDVSEALTTPFGDTPGIVHEVTLRNRTDRARPVTWWEYWDVNPYDQFLRIQRGLQRPWYDGAGRTLRVRQIDPLDRRPQSIFLAALPGTPVSGYETNTGTFFGAGTRATPAAVAADRARNSLASPALPTQVGRTMFALRSPVTLPPNGEITLRYLYGVDHDAAITRHVGAAAAQPNTLRSTAAAWRAWLPTADLGPELRHLAREVQWNAYNLRRSTQWEEECGHHIITQGNWYQYAYGQSVAFRDPLQFALPMTYAEPWITGQVLRYSMQEQEPRSGMVPYGMGPHCTRADFEGISSDFSFWLINAAAEYVMGTRDVDFLDERIPYLAAVNQGWKGEATAWEHLKLAYRHQESLRGAPNGNYWGLTGDWSDLSALHLPMTESVLITAQVAFAYPRLAELADLKGDTAFAAEVRTRADQVLRQLRSEWTGRGWYARAYAGSRQIGRGVIIEEPQPWALLAGAPDAEQTRTLLANIERFLTGSSKIGSSISPAANDPDVTERNWLYPSKGGADGSATQAGVWYSLNGSLVWALARLPGMEAKAFDEWRRNTLTAHAEAFPETWNGVTNSDDVCDAPFSPTPEFCALRWPLGTEYAGYNTHPHAWNVMGLLKLAGVDGTRDGYRIRPAIPLRRWSVRLGGAGVARDGATLRGYVRPLGDGQVTFEVTPPTDAPRWTAWVDGVAVPVTHTDKALRFTATATAGRALDWAVAPLTPAAAGAA
ncbi:MAG: hypothetical protein JHC95_01630 [Solirubrobacteraceae bacterium]|nr:hypothetical protein [Solirubrobacteraceae bacterium]